MGTTVKEKTNMWSKNSKESVKRESELYKMVESAAIGERQRTQRQKHDQGPTTSASKEKGRMKQGC